MPTIRVRPRHPVTGSPMVGEEVTVRYTQLVFGADSSTVARSSTRKANAQGFVDFLLDGSDVTDPVDVQVAFTWTGIDRPGLLATVPAGEGPHVDGSVHYWELLEVLDDGQLPPVPVVAGVQSVSGDGVDNTDPRNPVITGAGGSVDSVAGVDPDVDKDIPAAALKTALDLSGTNTGDQVIPTTLPPSGAAGGVLGGTYPNPSFAIDMATQAELDAEATARSNADSLLAPKASPALTGVPTAPTATSGTNTTQLATTAFVTDAVTTAVAGLYDLRGNYNASGNTFPATGGSGAAGAVLKGDVWVISVAGTLGGTAVVAGDQVLALVDTPGQTAGNWSIYEHDLGYTPENAANKSTSTSLGTSDTLYPSQKAVKTYADAETTRALAAEALLAPLASPVLTGNPTAPTQSAGNNSTRLATTAYVDTADALKASALTRQAKTANYTAVLGDMVVCDTTGGTFTVTLPAASGGKGRIDVKWVAGTVAPSIAVTGTDHIDTSTGSTGGSFSLLNQAVQYESDGTSIWVITASNYALSTLDTRHASGVWGDGSDGTVTISADTTLSRDMYYDNLTVNSTKTLFTNGWRVYVRNTCTNNGTIGAPGVQVGGGTNNFGSGTGGGAQNALNSGKNGGNGGNPGVGSAGTNASNPLTAAAGGAGGAGSGNAAGAGGTASAIAATANQPKSPLTAFTMLFYNASGLLTSAPGGGAGGGGGGGDGTNNGGGGGGGGGIVLLNARILVNNGSINADGQTGRSPVTGNVGGGGGGGGGAVLVNTTSSTGSGTVTANGGAGGTKVGTGVNGSAGSAGYAQTMIWTVA